MLAYSYRSVFSDGRTPQTTSTNTSPTSELEEMHLTISLTCHNCQSDVNATRRWEIKAGFKLSPLKSQLFLSHIDQMSPALYMPSRTFLKIQRDHLEQRSTLLAFWHGWHSSVKCSLVWWQRSQQKFLFLHMRTNVSISSFQSLRLCLFLLHSLHATPSPQRANSDPQRPTGHSLDAVLRKMEVKSEMSDVRYPVTSQSQHQTSPYFQEPQKHFVCCIYSLSLLNCTSLICAHLWRADAFAGFFFFSFRLFAWTALSRCHSSPVASRRVSQAQLELLKGSLQGANVSTSKGSATLLTWAVHRSFAYIRFRETDPCLRGRAENSQQTQWGSHWFYTELQAQGRRMRTELCRGWVISILCTMEAESFFEWDYYVKYYTRLSTAVTHEDNDNKLAKIKVSNKSYNGEPVVFKWHRQELLKSPFDFHLWCTGCWLIPGPLSQGIYLLLFKVSSLTTVGGFRDLRPGRIFVSWYVTLISSVPANTSRDITAKFVFLRDIT